MQDETQRVADRSGYSPAVLPVALVMTVVGAGTFNVLPLLTAGAVSALGFSDRQSGLLSLTITIGAGVAAVFAGLWIRSMSWPRAATIALGGMFAANVVAMLFNHSWIFMLAQGAAGFFSSSAFCLALTVLSDYRDSARTFGVAGAFQVGYQIIALLAGPTLLRLAGLNGVLALLAVSGGLTLFLVPWLPAKGRTVAPERAAPRELLKPATIASLLAFFMFFVNVGAYWTYIELMGGAQGLSSRVVANSVAGSIGTGILGGLLAWALGERFGRLWPIGITALLTIVAALLLYGRFGVAAFVVSGVLYYFAWNYSYPYQLAVVNEVDSTGRAVAITQAFGFLGMSVGAGLAALWVSPGDYRAVSWVAVIAVGVSVALYLLSAATYRFGAATMHA